MNDPELKPPTVDIVIFTVVEVEFTAVSNFLQNEQVFSHPTTKTIYLLGEFMGYRIVLRQISEQGNTSMASEAERALSFWNPQVAFLVGIAGGRKKVKLGDVVVVNRVYTYESGKETDGGLRFRDKGGKFNFELGELARFEGAKKKWLAYLPADQSHCQVWWGAIASGEKVITSSKTRIAKDIDQHCEDAIAVEMEGAGFAAVLHPLPHIKALDIRGISDLLDGKDYIYDAGYREIAARNAAAFAFYLISRLTFESKTEKKTKQVSDDSTGYTTGAYKKNVINNTGSINTIIQDVSGHLEINGSSMFKKTLARQEKIKSEEELQSLKASLKDLQAKNFGQAIAELKQILNSSSELYDNLIHLASRYERVQRIFDEGRLDFSSANQELNALGSNFLKIVNDLNSSHLV